MFFAQYYLRFAFNCNIFSTHTNTHPKTKQKPNKSKHLIICVHVIRIEKNINKNKLHIWIKMNVTIVWSRICTPPPTPIRCLDEDKLFPASKPVLCEEKNANPYFEIKCCRSDNCNKFIRFDPKRGERQCIQTYQPSQTSIHAQIDIKLYGDQNLCCQIDQTVNYWKFVLSRSKLFSSRF